VRPHQRDELDAGPEGGRARIGRLDGIGGGFEAIGRALDDRPQDFLLRGYVRVQAGALDVHGPSDVAHARPRVPLFMEEGAGRVLDLLATGGLDHPVPLTNAC